MNSLRTIQPAPAGVRQSNLQLMIDQIEELISVTVRNVYEEDTTPEGAALLNQLCLQRDMLAMALSTERAGVAALTTLS